MSWYNKHRPTTPDQYVWADQKLRESIMEWIDNPLKYPSIILHGSTGTGKTSLTQLIIAMLGERVDVQWIRASLTNGVEMIRDQVVAFCERGGFHELKIVVLDEADRLSAAAQEMLRNVMDQFDDDVRFIFTCNYFDKIVPPGRSLRRRADGDSSAAGRRTKRSARTAQ